MLYSLMVAVVIPFSLSWMTYNPLVQTFLARMVGSYLSERMNTVITLKGLYITPRLDLHANGFLALDRRSDTLFYGGDIFLDMKSLRFKESRKIFEINDIVVSDAYFSLIKDVNDSAFTYSFIRDHFETTDTTTVIDTIHGQTKWQVSLTALDLKNVRFRYIDETKPKIEPGMDYSNLDIFVNSLELEDLKILNDTFNFTVNELSCYDRCGFVLDKMQGKFRLSPLFLIADSLLIHTPRSDIDLDLDFRYDAWSSYLNFTDEVKITSSIRPSEINLVDIGYFAPTLLVMDNLLRIGGDVKGTVHNLKVSDFRFTYGNSTRFSGDVKLFGLPYVRETFIYTNITEFVITQDDIESFAIPGDIRHVQVPEDLEVLGKMKIKGTFTGFYNDFVSTADFVSDIGKISTDISLTQNEDHTDIVYEGEVHAQRFDMGKFLKLEEYLGEMDLNAMVSGSGLSAETVNINMHGNIDSLEFMGNIFNQVAVRGDIANNKFNGYVDVQDDLINFDFEGIMDFNQEKPLFDFTANIFDADLFNLNMLDRDSILKLSLMLNCNFIGYKPEDLEGRILIDSLYYTEGEKEWFMNHLAFISLKGTDLFRKIMLSSDFMDAQVQGNFTTLELMYAIDDMIGKEFSNWTFMPAPAPDLNPQSLSFNIEVKETEDLLNIFVPGLFVQDRSMINGMFNSESSIAEIDAMIPYVSYRGIQSDSIHFTTAANGNNIVLGSETKRILLKEREKGDTLQLGLEEFNFNCTIDNDSLIFGLGWNDEDAIRHNMADITGYYINTDSNRSELRFTKAMAMINDSLWTIRKNSRLIFGDRYFNFENIDVIGGSQSLKLNGILSEKLSDTLTVEFIKWRLSNFDIIFRNYDFSLRGIINGGFGLSNVYELPGFYSNLFIKNLTMNRVLIGDAMIHSVWNNDQSSVDVISEIIYYGNVGESNVLSLKGSYFPERTTDNLDFELNLANLRLEPFGSFINSYLSGLKGVVSGDFKIAGSTQKPTLRGEMRFMRTECRINYLNTRYSFADTIDFDYGKIKMKDLIVYDTAGNQAVANGVITHKNLSDFNFDIHVKATDFICTNTNRYQNEAYYGSAIVSGDVWFYGYSDDFHIDADVVTARGADIVLPLNNSFTVTDNDFVIFRGVELKDEFDALDYTVDLKGLNIDFRIGIQNTAELMIFLPGNMGNINSKGFGEIRFTIDPRGDFRIYGDYNFLRGTFFFSLQNIINKRFEIQQGGKISFDGNPYNADVNLKALYRLKTSLSGLGATISPEYEGQRVNVNAYLGLKGKLANPDIHFSIDFPNVKNEVKQTIYAILDTNDAGLMNQQMVSLLLMNNFSYASNSTNMSASSLNIISSQLSNWLSQISRDVDIGINYIPGDDINRDEVEVALSTQFFDNRLIVDGNVGVMTKDNTGQQDASNIVGDVNIEYKLRPDGRIRLRAFNRSNNFNSIDYYSPYTQGVGVFYTKDFDRFGDIFKRQRKKRDEIEVDIEE